MNDKIEKGTLSPEELDDLSAQGDSQPPTEPEPVSEDVKPPEAEPTAPQPEKKEEKTVPYDRFKKVNDELTTLKKETKSAKEEEVKSSSSPVELVRLGKKLEGYSNEELDFIIDHAGSDDTNKILEASKDEFVQLAIKAKRQKVADDNKVPASTYGGFSNDSGKDIKDMSTDEFKKLEEKARTESQRGHRGV